MTLRLTCSSIPRLRPLGLLSERLLDYMYKKAIYTMNSFQFTRPARLILAH